KSETWTIDQKKAPWCGSFCGWNYGMAGFDMKGKLDGRLNIDGKTPGRKHLIFLSAARLSLYLTRREGCKHLAFPSGAAGKKLSTREHCVEWLEKELHGFGPQPGDVLLFDTVGPLTHVGIVASYDPKSFELVTYEGNYQKRCAAVSWDLAKPGKQGFHRVNFIGRFPEADFAHEPRIRHDAHSPDPTIEQGDGSVTGR